MKNNLYKQLISIAVIVVGIIFIALGILLPRTLLPVYEKTIYQFLAQPLVFIGGDMQTSEIIPDVAYIYIPHTGGMLVSENYSEIIDADVSALLERIDDKYGKFRYKTKTYYYYRSDENRATKISLTNDTKIVQIRRDILYTMLPILIITLLLIAALLLWWSRRLVVKIEKLKEKVDNLDNDSYMDTSKFDTDDELNALSIAIDDMKETLKKQEEYKNQMYQNISHDFKTPLTVIKSYMEAIEDNVGDPKDSYEIIKEQINKLELKVHSLLYLNKLNYIKESENFDNAKTDVLKIIDSSVKKFKLTRPDVNFSIDVFDKKTEYNGTYDMWEAIIDNILNNAIRFAEKEIKITIKNNRLTFYNDGPQINPKILDDIFSPYKKGINGQFGLGLSIVKKTIALAGYEISVKNEKKGVSFMIK